MDLEEGCVDSWCLLAGTEQGGVTQDQDSDMMDTTGAGSNDSSQTQVSLLPSSAHFQLRHNGEFQLDTFL